MARLQLNLPENLSLFIEEGVKHGYYRSADDVIQTALEKMAREHQEKLNNLRAALAEGIEQAEQGRFVEYSLEELNAELDAEIV